MIQGAREDAAEHPLVQSGKAKLDFRVLDCSKPVRQAEAPFDLCFAGCFFNYVPTEVELADMFRMVAVNLKDGGRLVAIMPDLDSYEEQEACHIGQVIRDPKYGMKTTITEKLEQKEG